MYIKLFKHIKTHYQQAIVWLSYLLVQPAFASSDSNPFPSISVSNGDVLQTAGSKMETALKYSLLGGGGLLLIICLGVLINRLKEDSKEKDHGNMIMTFILLALGATIGFVLIGIGWTATSAQIQ